MGPWLICELWGRDEGLLVSWRCALDGPAPDAPTPAEEPVRLALSGEVDVRKAQRLHRKLRSWLHRTSPDALFVDVVGPAPLAFDLGFCLRDWPLLRADEVEAALAVEVPGGEEVSVAETAEAALVQGHDWDQRPCWVALDGETWLHLDGEQSPDDLDQRLIRARHWNSTGRTLEAQGLYDRIVADSSELDHHLEAIEAAEALGDTEMALERTRLSLERFPDAPELLDLRARLALEGIDEALAASPARWRHAVARWIRAGDLARAESIAEEHGGPTQARFALWRTDTETARDLATGDDPEALLVQGAARLLDGEPQAALPFLRQALQPEDTEWLTRDTVLTWQSAALLAMGRGDEALSVADRAMTVARVWNLHAQIQRVRAKVARYDGRQLVLDSVLEPVFEKLPELFGPRGDRFVEGAIPALEAALPRFGGNRSPWPTLWDGDTLTRVFPAPHLRHEARMLQKLLLTRPIDEVIRRFDAFKERWPGRVYPLTFRGEALLWLGRYADAEAAFLEALALQEATVWGWIGLGAAQMLQDQVNDALVTWERGVEVCDFEGPSLFAYRGEAWQRLGEDDRARSDLQTAREAKPTRLSAWLNLGLLGEPVMDRFERYPQLIADMGRLAGSDEPRAMLLALREASRGNRSSMMTTYFVDGKLRSCHFSP